MIIQRQYVPFRILIETDPRSEAAIDKGFYDIAIPKAESRRLKRYNLESMNSLHTIEMGSGVVYPSKMAAALKELDILYPYDNGYTSKDIVRREICQVYENDSLTKVIAYDKHEHIISVDYYGDPYQVAKAYDQRFFLPDFSQERDKTDGESPANYEETFVFFWHEYQKNGYLSNWARTPFTIEGIEYVHMEQYIMAKKALLFADFESYAKIMKEEDPGLIKKMGRNVKNFNQYTWDQTLPKILKTGLTAKFNQNYKLAKYLLETGDATLAEASPYDKIYGIGLSADDPNAELSGKWPGKNLLGKNLMEVRQELKIRTMMESISCMWMSMDNFDRPSNFYLMPEEKQEIRDFLNEIMQYEPDNLLIV